MQVQKKVLKSLRHKSLLGTCLCTCHETRAIRPKCKSSISQLTLHTGQFFVKLSDRISSKRNNNLCMYVKKYFGIKTKLGVHCQPLFASSNSINYTFLI